MTIICIFVSRLEGLKETLESVKNVDTKILVYDTVSSIDTSELIAKYTDNVVNDLFIDFSTSKNNMIKYAESQCAHESLLLILNTGEVLVEGKRLLEHLRFQNEIQAFSIKHVYTVSTWITSCFRAHTGWRYTGKIFEEIRKTETSDSDSQEYISERTGPLPTSGYIDTRPFQKVSKSSIAVPVPEDIGYIKLKVATPEPRETVDRLLSLEDRDVLFTRANLALGRDETELALRLFTERAGYPSASNEEQFISCMYAGDLTQIYHEAEKAEQWYNEALEVAKANGQQKIQPLIRLAVMYRTAQPDKAIDIIEKACALDPSDEPALSTNRIYEYTRFHLRDMIIKEHKIVDC